MPNYKLCDDAKRLLKRRVNNITGRLITQASANFPLDAEFIQSQLVEPAHLEMLRILDSHVRGLPRHDVVYFDVPASDWGTKRAAIIKIHSRSRFFVAKGVNSIYGAPDRDETPNWGYNKPLETLNIANVPEHLRPRVTKWVDNFVTQVRLHEIATCVADYMIDDYVPTVGHCAARWPTLVDVGRGVRDYGQHFLHPPRRALAMYNWPADFAPKLPGLKKLLALADQAIATALMLPDDVAVDEKYNAQVIQWRPLENDWGPSKIGKG